MIAHRLPSLLLSLVIAAAAAAQDAPLEGSVEVEGKSYPYRLLTPANIEDGKRYPLVVFLHGAGERGNDNEGQLRHFPVKMLSDERREKYPCYILAPQCPRRGFWVHVDWNAERSTPFARTPEPSMQGAIAALEEVVGQHAIDLDRIYLTGLSMGGYGSWDLATRHPSWFASVAPVCGGGDEREVARLAGMPISVWHGAADRVVPASRSQVMVESMRELGLEVDYHELTDVGHNAWVQAYGDEGCLDWMFDTSRNPRAQLDAAARLAAESLASDERVAFLGDSITQGGNNPGGYVDLLRTVFNEVRPESTVIPAGISGHKVPDLLGRYERDVIEKDATLVFIYIGINDVWHSQSGRGTPADEYEAGLRKLVRDFKASGADVVLATPSVIGERAVGDNALDEMLLQYAAISRTVAEDEGATLCDLNRAFQDHLRIFNTPGADRGVLTNDGVHLNAEGNVFVAVQAARALRRAALARDATP